MVSWASRASSDRHSVFVPEVSALLDTVTFVSATYLYPRSRPSKEAIAFVSYYVNGRLITILRILSSETCLSFIQAVGFIAKNSYIELIVS